jgi:hypothetical protein
MNFPLVANEAGETIFTAVSNFLEGPRSKINARMALGG